VNTVVVAYEPERGHPNHLPLKENLSCLGARRDLKVKLPPMPGPVVFSGQILPASYANFYIANRLVLVP
jgi:agmatine deiminase